MIEVLGGFWCEMQLWYHFYLQEMNHFLLIKKWYFENKEKFDLENFNLEENVDYTLNIDLDNNNDGTASIKCKCAKLISLGKNDSKIQVSNYYKHLQSKGCDHMKRIVKAERDLKSMQQQSSISVTSTSIVRTYPSQTHAPVIQLPDVSPTTVPTTSRSDFPVVSNQVTQNGKCRLASQLQQQHSTKRSGI
ncbi:unnamed protein product [Rotaria sp. Silwood1]|nr:unnamed protein product [Rotaria sp. Silwood1]CAF1657761.1 unnamed protein product [Rotaria sp. Silwood1]CAF3771539.1 unnamed protein product [Rotaria sp. Silwood1]CAF3823185.1 unnamed protein product [Rotaria sp. Silwood1]CAF4754920.1 unnamed protein product [Rotaria sp. Silwood1]